MRRAKLTFGHSGHCQSPSLMPEGGAPGRPPRYGGCVWGFGAASSTKTVFRARFGVSLMRAVQSEVALQSAILLLDALLDVGSAATRGRGASAVGAAIGQPGAPGGRSRCDCGPLLVSFCPLLRRGTASGNTLASPKKHPPPRKNLHAPRQTKMILTNCAACAAPLAHNAPRCVRCKVRYCDRKCQMDHEERAHVPNATSAWRPPRG